MSEPWNTDDEHRLTRGLDLLAEAAPSRHDLASWTPLQQRGPRPSRWAPFAMIAAAAVAVATVSAISGVFNQTTGGPQQDRDGDPAASAPLTSGSATSSTGSAVVEPDAVRAAAAPLAALESTPGFGRVVLDLDRGRVTVFWRGQPPVAVTQRLGTTATGVVVELTAADYSQADLSAAADRLLRSQDADLPAIFLARPRPDLSGLIVEAAAGSTAPDQQARIAAAAGVPVDVVPGVAPVAQ